MRISLNQNEKGNEVILAMQLERAQALRDHLERVMHVEKEEFSVIDFYSLLEEALDLGGE